MSYNRKTFFDLVRASFGKLSPAQVEGFNFILDAWEKAYPKGDPRFLAYALATAWHETGYTMQPIREAYGISTADSIRRLDKAWAAGKLGKVKTPYWRTGFFGRGYVQLTHESNYRKAQEKLKSLFGISVDFVKNPDDVMKPEYAVLIMFVGMIEGWFAGDDKGRHTLARHFNAKVDDPLEARRIINGTDERSKIAGHHKLFLAVLKGSQESIEAPAPIPATPVAPEVPEPAPAAPVRPKEPSLVVTALIALKLWITGKL